MGNANLGRRLASVVLDLFGWAFLFGFFITLISGFFFAQSVSHAPIGITDLTSPGYYFMLMGIAVYFCKDCINGRSPGKRVTDLVIIDYKTLQPASPFKCFTRNIFLVILPIEMLAILFNSGKRIGDLAAGTIVARFDPASQQKTYSASEKIKPFIATFLLLFTLSFFGARLNRVDVVESSYNESESRKLRTVMTDSLSSYLDSVDARVYDKVKNKGIKYISVIYYLKENYISNTGDDRAMKQLTDRYLYAMFPSYSFSGQSQFFYNKGGSYGKEEYNIGK